VGRYSSRQLRPVPRIGVPCRWEGPNDYPKFLDTFVSSLYSRLSEVFRLKSSFLSDTGEHFRSKFIAIRECPCIGIRKIRISEFKVRTFLCVGWFPSDTDKRSVHDPRFSTGPLTHAMARSSLMFGGSSSEFSTSSATARSAIAYALFIASSLVLPYASAPGISGISAIQRPSVSCSSSTLNRKSWLLVLRGGLDPIITMLRMPEGRSSCTLRRFF